MRILILAKDYPPTVGGVENYSKNLAEGLNKEDDVTVVSFHSMHGVHEYTDKCKVNRLKPVFNSEIIKAIYLFIYLFIYLLFNKTDLIIGTTWKITLPLKLLKPIFNVKFMIIAHGAEITRHKKSAFKMFLMRSLMKSAEKIIAVSAFTKTKFLEYNPKINEAKIVVIPNGICFDAMSPIKTNLARQKLGFKAEDYIILTVSRIDERKGHDIIINSLPKLIKVIPKLKYLIVGNGKNFENIKSLVKQLNIEDHVIFTGYVELNELNYYYSCCDLFALLNKMDDDSDFEGFGLVFAEAGYYSKPVIAGNNGGPKEVVSHGITGYLIEPNIESFNEIFIKHNLFNKKRLITLGVNAKNYVIDQFSIARKIERVKKVVQNL